MKIKVAGSDVHIVKDELVVTGSLNAYEIEFVFDAAWNQMTNKTAVFYQPTVNRDNPIYRLIGSDNKIIIPQESLLAGDYLYIGVFGFTNHDEVRLPTIFTYTYVKQGCYKLEQIPVPEPSIYEEIYNMALEAYNISKKSEDMIAPEFNPELDYAVNDKVIYNDILYKFLEEHHAGDEWDSSKVVKIYIKDELGGGGGGGGDHVVVTPTLDEGTKVADISVNGSNQELYAPNPTQVSVTPEYDSGDKIAEVLINGESTDLIVPTDKLSRVAGMIATEFNKDSKYDVGELVTHDYALYKFTSIHAEGDEWDPEEVSTATISDYLGVILVRTLAAGNTTVVFTNDIISSNSIIDIYTSVYGVSPTSVEQDGHSIVMIFEKQNIPITVGLKIVR